MELAARTLVKLGQLPGSKGIESFEYDIKRAFEFISEERNEQKRHAAVIILRELAVAMPTFFYLQVSTFFDHIFYAIRDPKPLIREGAGQALRAALIVTSQRESTKSTNKPQWYKQCYDEAILCFGEVPLKEKGVTKDDRVHGALIVLNEILRCSNAVWERKYLALKRLHPEQPRSSNDEGHNILPRFPFDRFVTGATQTYQFLTTQNPYPYDYDTDSKFSRQHLTVQESATCRNIIVDSYEGICQRVLEQKYSKSIHVQQSLLNILPRLAAFNRDLFVKNHLKNIVNYLLMTLRGKEKDRNIAFITLGFIAVAVEKDIEKYIPKIMEVIKSSLPQKETPNKKKIVVDPAVFMCITLLGHAMKSGIGSDIKVGILENFRLPPLFKIKAFLAQVLTQKY
jgi:FKBP12-rapamycin complex-associated protein